MTSLIASDDMDSLYTDSDNESLFQSHPDNSSFASDELIHDNKMTNTSIETSPVKAILFNTNIPVSYQKHHLQLFTEDGSFSTILKEDPLCTVIQVKNYLIKKFNFDKDFIIILMDESTGLKKVLYDNDKIIKIQSKIFRSMWIDERDLPMATLKFKHSFKFVLHRI